MNAEHGPDASSNTMHRLLLIAPAFPPVNRQSSRRAAAMAKYLSRLGWHVTVLTSQPADYSSLMSPDEAKAVLEEAAAR